MTTAARRRERLIEARVTIVFVSALLVLLLLGFARIYSVTQDLKQAQAAACALRIKGRANTNTHDRVPLRAALNYIASLGTAGEKGAATAKQREASRLFVARFAGYARLVTPLPNPKC